MSDFPSHPYPWQLQEWQQLNLQIAANKLPHALMFSGPKGIGKRHLAESLAQLLLCLAPIEGTPCGKCRGCLLNKVDVYHNSRSRRLSVNKMARRREPRRGIKIAQLDDALLYTKINASRLIAKICKVYRLQKSIPKPACAILQEACYIMLEAEGGMGMVQLAAQCRTALSRAGFNVPPREYDSKTEKGTHPDPR
ncbi:MAG: hypothetical protein EOO68_05120 [Moraxellaceae bacterium]|nr:MAG: hypothetical protein EOO68_05120 [Moraxellaceae bacterium]